MLERRGEKRRSEEAKLRSRGAEEEKEQRSRGAEEQRSREGEKVSPYLQSCDEALIPHAARLLAERIQRRARGEVGQPASAIVLRGGAQFGDGIGRLEPGKGGMAGVGLSGVSSRSRGSEGV